VKRCTLRAPDGKSTAETTLLAKKIDRPTDIETIRWVKLPNTSNDTLDKAAELINWYWCIW
jgi:hypothetical protein